MAGAVDDVVELDPRGDAVGREVADGDSKRGAGLVEHDRADNMLETDVLCQVELGEAPWGD